MALILDINGEKRTVDVPPDTIRLYVLRNDRALNAARYGCGFGQCGACTVTVEGRAVRSCTTRSGEVAGEMPIRVSALRTLGACANVFALESFIDELALAAAASANAVAHATGKRLRRLPFTPERVRV